MTSDVGGACRQHLKLPLSSLPTLPSFMGLVCTALVIAGPCACLAEASSGGQSATSGNSAAIDIFAKKQNLSIIGTAVMTNGATPPFPKTPIIEIFKPLVTKPQFEDIGPRNITAIVGHDVLLKCRVKYSGNRTISWMRKHDLHILTSGMHTYTGDGRFKVEHVESSDDWNLRIEDVQSRDGGIYECQLNTEPKINMAIALRVEDAQAVILGPPDVYVKKGSTISLTCAVNAQSSAQSTMAWHRGYAVVDFDNQRGGISLETEKTESGITSKLLITGATFSDTGNYTCVPSNAKPASVYVHILNGENPAAMQTGRGNIQQSTMFLILILGVNFITR